MDERKNETPFRVTLEGAGRLEDRPLREIAEFLDGLVTLVARASAGVLHRPQPAGGGRYEGPIEDASHIRLASLTSGSVVAEILPAPASPLHGAINLDAETLSEQAIGRVIEVAAGRVDGDPELARAFSAFVDSVVGRRPGASLRFEDRRPSHQRDVVVDARFGETIRAALSATTHLEGDVTGRLFEANLEARSAQVRTPSGERVDIQFDPDHDQDIRRSLGGRAAVKGEIIYDPHTKRARAVHVREIVTGDQLALDFEGADFWIDRPASDLIAETGAGPVADPGDLQLQGVSEAEWEALYQALGIAP
jgi:hypothetical protein